ncbi:MAG: hypothetical protein Q7S31_03695 [bacterium]|nr:hypothetical protein [bacterium]
MTITATSSMLRVDPASSSDNQVQAVMSNGDKVGLTYDSASGGNTVWKGTYIIPANTAGGTYSGALQAIAYNVTTDVTTSFNSLPTGFNNTGITATFCYGVSSSAACSPSTTSVASPDIKGAGAGGIVSQNNVVSVVPAHTFNYDAYFSVTSAPQIQAFNLPGTNYWQISPVYLLWWKSFFNDANILSSELNKPFIISLPYAISAYTPNLTLNNLKLAHSTDNKHWKVLANIIQNKNNKTIGLVTKNGGYYMIVAGSVLANQPILGAKTEDTELQLAPSPLPTVEPTSIPTLQPTPMPAPKKHCFWFICF